VLNEDPAEGEKPTISEITEGVRYHFHQEWDVGLSSHGMYIFGAPLNHERYVKSYAHIILT
jgi:hypothetical protein